MDDDRSHDPAFSCSPFSSFEGRGTEKLSLCPPPTGMQSSVLRRYPADKQRSAYTLGSQAWAAAVRSAFARLGQELAPLPPLALSG